MLLWKGKKGVNWVHFVGFPFQLYWYSLNIILDSFILSSQIKDPSFQYVTNDLGQLKANSYNPGSFTCRTREDRTTCLVLEKPLETKLTQLKGKVLFKFLMFISNCIVKFGGHVPKPSNLLPPKGQDENY